MFTLNILDDHLIYLKYLVILAPYNIGPKI